MRNLHWLLALALLSGTPCALAALSVFACEPDWASLARELGGGDVEVYSAITALQDVHKIQPRPSLIARYRQADLAVCTGAELEIAWLGALAGKANNPKLLPGRPGYFEASRFVRMLDIPASVDRSLGDLHPYGNPHVQTSPHNILPVARALAGRMAALDASRAAAYRDRLALFEQRWTAALATWDARARPLRGVRVVSHHKTWVYLYDWLGIDEVARLEPKPGIPPSGAHLQEVLETIRRTPARMVVHSAYEDARASEWLAERAHIPVVQLPLSVGGAPGADDLFGLYDVTLDRLLRAAGA